MSQSPPFPFFSHQAFRALNQGLGRCIRHRHDWGAILLVDCRFSQQPRYPKMLSKWVRGILSQQSSFSATLASLKSFIGRHHKPPPASGSASEAMSKNQPSLSDLGVTSTTAAATAAASPDAATTNAGANPAGAPASRSKITEFFLHKPASKQQPRPLAEINNAGIRPVIAPAPPPVVAVAVVEPLTETSMVADNIRSGPSVELQLDEDDSVMEPPPAEDSGHGAIAGGTKPPSVMAAAAMRKPVAAAAAAVAAAAAAVCCDDASDCCGDAATASCCPARSPAPADSTAVTAASTPIKQRVAPMSASVAPMTAAVTAAVAPMPPFPTGEMTRCESFPLSEDDSMDFFSSQCGAEIDALCAQSETDRAPAEQAASPSSVAQAAAAGSGPALPAITVLVNNGAVAAAAANADDTPGTTERGSAPVALRKRKRFDDADPADPAGALACRSCGKYLVTDDDGDDSAPAWRLDRRGEAALSTFNAGSGLPPPAVFFDGGPGQDDGKVAAFSLTTAPGMLPPGIKSSVDRGVSAGAASVLAGVGTRMAAPNSYFEPLDQTCYAILECGGDGCGARLGLMVLTAPDPDRVGGVLLLERCVSASRTAKAPR